MPGEDKALFALSCVHAGIFVHLRKARFRTRNSGDRLKTGCSFVHFNWLASPFTGSLLSLMNSRTNLVTLLLIATAISLPAQTAVESQPRKQGAALLKTDILTVFAHPDDETGVSAVLAEYALAKGKVVATVYCTRGEGGGNMVGTQWGQSLGI